MSENLRITPFNQASPEVTRLTAAPLGSGSSYHSSEKENYVAGHREWKKS
jgi:hypothetical protein